MAYRSKSRSRRSSKVKYSVENVGVEISAPGSKVNGLYQFGQTIVPATDIQGTRSVRHLTVSLSTDAESAAGSDSEFYWALVFVPQGYNAN